MDKKEKSTRTGSILSILVSILLIVSIVLNIVLYANNGSLNTQINTLTDTSTALTTDLENANAEAVQSAQDLLAANATIDQMTLDAATASASLESLTAQFDALQADYSAYQAQAEAAQTASDATIADLQAQLNTLQGDFAAYQAKAEGIQTADTVTIADLQAQLTALQADFTAYQTDAENMQATDTTTIADLQAQLTALQADFAAYQTEAESVQATDTTTIADLQTQLTALQTDFTAYQTNAEGVQATDTATIADLQAQLTAMQTQLSASQAEVAAYAAQAEAAATTETADAAVTADAEAAVTETANATADTTAQEAMAEEAVLAPDAIVATVNGEPVYGSEVLKSYQYIVNYYGEPDEGSLELYYAVAMDEAITLKLVTLTAAALGLDQHTQEELDAIYTASDADWNSALEGYVSNNYAFTDATTDDEKAAAYAAAEAYYGTMGYSQQILRDSYVESDTYERVKNELCKDVTVTDEDVQAYYDEMVQNDQALYENDIASYENAVMMYNYGYADGMPWYRPAGYRYAKHILLSVDETLLTAYTDLAARFAEQTDPEAEGAVTAQDVEDAKAAILASVQGTLDEINQKLANGATFDELMAEYGTDPGMTGGDYPNGYEVSAVSQTFVPEFVAAVFSVNNIGDISQPVVSEYGVHLVQYAGDVPSGPVALTDELKATISQTLLDGKCNDALNAWYNAADIVYAGVIRSVNEINANTPEE